MNSNGVCVRLVWIRIQKDCNLSGMCGTVRWNRVNAPKQYQLNQQQKHNQQKNLQNNLSNLRHWNENLCIHYYL